MKRKWREGKRSPTSFLQYTCTDHQCLQCRPDVYRAVAGNFFSTDEKETRERGGVLARGSGERCIYISVECPLYKFQFGF